MELITWFASPRKLCKHREHRSLWHVEGAKSIKNSQNIQSMNCFVICQARRERFRVVKLRGDENWDEECRREKGTSFL